MPVFLTKINVELTNEDTQYMLITHPYRFNFRQRAILKAVTWWGISETLRNAAGDRNNSGDKPKYVPNSWFKGLSQAQLETTRKQDPEDICNYAIYYLMAGKGRLDYLKTRGCITTKGLLRTDNVCITATGFSSQWGSDGDNGPLIQCDAETILEISGLTLVGNNTFNSKSSVPGVTRPTFAGNTNYDLYGFQPTLINTSNIAADSTVSCAFGRSGRPIIQGPSNYLYNVTHINWHLITNEGKYMTKEDAAYDSNPTEDRNKMGPGFRHIFGSLTRNRRLLRFCWNSYRDGQIDSNKSGIAGNFGFITTNFGNPGAIAAFQVATLSSSRSPNARDIDYTKGIPEDEIPQGTLWNLESNNTFIKKNGRDFPSNPTVATDSNDPSIMDRKYTYGEPEIQLGVKYAQIRPGLDYLRNYQSNRFLYG
jgi:hypothetical protein